MKFDYLHVCEKQHQLSDSDNKHEECVRAGDHTQVGAAAEHKHTDRMFKFMRKQRQ